MQQAFRPCDMCTKNYDPFGGVLSRRSETMTDPLVRHVLHQWFQTTPAFILFV